MKRPVKIKMYGLMSLLILLFGCSHYNHKIERSSSFLFSSENLNDGLKLKSTYITNILKCVPPGDKPMNEELSQCSNYFIKEIDYLKKIKVIVTLGKVAFDLSLIHI